MKRTTPMRRTGFGQRGDGLRRSPIKRSQPKRNWVAARMKLSDEGCCRSCGAATKLEAAHIIGREHDRQPPVGHRWGTDGPWEQPYVVDPTRVIPLCSDCHRADHRGELDTLPLLALSEQIQAVADAGGVELMRLRTLPSENPKRVAV